MTRRFTAAALVLLVTLSARAASETPIPQLYIEVSALSMLYDLAATPDQIKSIQSLSPDPAANKPATDPAGLTGKDHPSVRDAVASFLDKTHSLSDDELKAQHADLETQARKLTPTPDPLAVITHWIQRDMAELLSNPQL